MKTIAFFVTPHGFGHAGRAAAVMAALQEIDPSLRLEIFTKVPEWFFRESLPGPFGYHSILTDIGLVQHSALREDLAATVRRLNEFLPFDPARLDALAAEVKLAGCESIVCDIAPLGIAVARTAGVPSVLVENFTWDWIYDGYARDDTRLSRHVAYLRNIFESADHHIQTEPVSVYHPADLLTPPVSRSPRKSRSEIREKLSIPGDAQAVLITMGGIASPPGAGEWRHQHTFLSQLQEHSRLYFVIPGSRQSVQMEGNLVLLPHHSRFFHPDLINACDAVIGKLGYSTVAEVYRAGVPFGYIPRARFRESEALAAFAQAQMNGIEIPETRFHNGAWLSLLPDLLALPRIRRIEPNGAAQVAEFIYGLVTH